MNTVQRITKITRVLLVSQNANYIIGISIMYTARYLGAKGIGVLYFALALLINKKLIGGAHV